MAANLMQVEWANAGPNLWTVDLEETLLVEGQATYDVDPTTIMILDAYIRIGEDEAIQDRILLPISRSDYAAYPNKSMQGFPTIYWFDRLVAPTLTVWLVPDGDQEYLLRYYRFRQIQDAVLQGGLQPEIQYRFNSAYAHGLAAMLALTYAPTKYAMLKQVADEKFRNAATQDVESVGFSIVPGTGSYWR